ncbi:unnamed protein product [Meloidogyne enterolobii]|uniref:Uncharacterized protein n=1 Tax=Meloidogyne enterolobii TaxID=390850 RepID=A0ACB0Y6H0_MELEN
MLILRPTNCLFFVQLLFFVFTQIHFKILYKIPSFTSEFYYNCFFTLKFFVLIAIRVFIIQNIFDFFYKITEFLKLFFWIL